MERAGASVVGREYAAPVPELRNVIVFSLGAVRYAVELRWIREVITLGFVTSVPSAPACLAGVCNLHGTILPVLDVGVLLGGTPGAIARQGDGALVLELTGVASEGGGTVCAVRVDQVDHVASLHDTGAGAVVDATGRPLTLIDPTHLVRIALDQVTTAAAEHTDEAHA